MEGNFLFLNSMPSFMIKIVKGKKLFCILILLVVFVGQSLPNAKLPLLIANF